MRWPMVAGFGISTLWTTRCGSVCLSTSSAHCRRNMVIAALDRVARARCYAPRIVCDNGPESPSEATDQWADHHGITLPFIEPGRPVQKTFIESFN